MRHQNEHFVSCVQTENLLNGPKTWLAQGAMTTLCGRSTPPAGFRDSIELARFVAAFGVVIAHAVLSPKDWFGHTALSLFLILTAFLMAQSTELIDVGQIAWLIIDCRRSR